MYTTIENTINLGPETGETFVLRYSSNLDGEQEATVAQDYPGGADLFNLAAQIRRFLLAAGYDYVADVVIVSDEGDEYAASSV
jgi:hypothetical protein